MSLSDRSSRPELKPGEFEDFRPVDPASGAPLPLTNQPGYYPGFSTLAQQNFWDETTRKLVLDRVYNVPPVQFFQPDELPLITAILDRILPQDDRDPACRVPLVNYVDDRLFHNRINGYRYADMPPDREAHRLGMQGIDALAKALYGSPFVELSPSRQEAVLKTVHDGQPAAGQEFWQKLNITRYWQLLVQDAIEAYYAHPYAWDEIGFGGPAYPRGYMRQEGGKPEPWEKPERRYKWAAPPGAVSGEYSPIGGKGNNDSHYGQEGTH